MRVYVAKSLLVLWGCWVESRAGASTLPKSKGYLYKQFAGLVKFFKGSSDKEIGIPKNLLVVIHFLKARLQSCSDPGRRELTDDLRTGVREDHRDTKISETHGLVPSLQLDAYKNTKIKFGD